MDTDSSKTKHCVSTTWFHSPSDLCQSNVGKHMLQRQLELEMKAPVVESMVLAPAALSSDTLRSPRRRQVPGCGNQDAMCFVVWSERCTPLSCGVPLGEGSSFHGLVADITWTLPNDSVVLEELSLFRAKQSAKSLRRCRNVNV